MKLLLRLLSEFVKLVMSNEKVFRTNVFIDMNISRSTSRYSQSFSSELKNILDLQLIGRICY